MVSRPERLRKGLVAFDDFDYGWFIGVTALGTAGDNFIFENWFIYSISFRPSLCRLEL